MTAQRHPAVLRGADFLRPLPRTGGLPALWLATALAVLASAGAEAWPAWQALRDQQAALSDWRARQAQRRPPAAAPAARAAADAAGRLMAEQRQRAAYPWVQVWSAAEAALLPGLQGLSLAHQAGQALQLEAEAPDVDHALAAAAALRQHPAWQQVLMPRLAPAGQGVRLSLQARPATPALALPGPAQPAAAATLPSARP